MLIGAYRSAGHVCGASIDPEICFSTSLEATFRPWHFQRKWRSEFLMATRYTSHIGGLALENHQAPCAQPFNRSRTVAGGGPNNKARENSKVH